MRPEPFRRRLETAVVVGDERLPDDFPVAGQPDPAAVEADIALALAQRPELLELDNDQLRHPFID